MMYVKYAADSGAILNVTKAEAMPEGLEQPFGPLATGEAVLVVGEADPAAALDVLRVHDGYRVDVRAKKLVRRRR